MKPSIESFRASRRWRTFRDPRGARNSAALATSGVFGSAHIASSTRSTIRCASFEVRLVSDNGGIKWNRSWVNVSQVLGGEYVGFEEIDDGEWNVYLGRMKLGRFHERLNRIEDAEGRLSRKGAQG